MFQNECSWAEKAITTWSTLLLACLSFGSVVVRYITSPIQCFGPSQMTLKQTLFYEQKCFQEERYLPISSHEPGLPDNWDTSASYHLWVPLVLAVGALLCLLPHVVWSVASRLLWLDVQLLLQNLKDALDLSLDRRQPLLGDAAALLVTALKRGNSLLTLASFCRKSLTAIMGLVQAVLVARLFQPQFLFQPWDAGHDVNNSTVLPRGEFICSFVVHQAGSIAQYHVQCFLPINEIYSKGFTFLFYFFLLLTVFCGVDLLTWVARVMVPGLRDCALSRYVDAAVSSGSEIPGEEDSLTSETCPRLYELLGWDGRLVLALVAEACGPLVAMGLTRQLARKWFALSIVSRTLAEQPLRPHVTADRQSGAIPLIHLDQLRGGQEMPTKK